MPRVGCSQRPPRPIPAAFIVRQALGAAGVCVSQSGTICCIVRDGSSRRITTSYSCRPGQVTPRRFGTRSRLRVAGALGGRLVLAGTLPVQAAFFVRLVLGTEGVNVPRSGTSRRIVRDGSSRRIATSYSCRPGLAVSRRFGTSTSPSLGVAEAAGWFQRTPQAVSAAFIARQVVGAAGLSVSQSGSGGRFGRGGTSRRIATSYIAALARQFLIGSAHLPVPVWESRSPWVGRLPRTLAACSGCVHRQAGRRFGTL
jgi:hypothetical protein